MRLRSYLLALAVVTVLPLLIFSVVMIVSTFFEHLGAVKERLVNTSRAISLAVDRKVMATIEALETLASLDLIDADDFPRFRRQAERVVAAHGTWVLMTVIAPSGRRIFDLGDAPRPSGGNAQFFQQALAARWPAVSDLVGEGTLDGRIVYVSVPVIRDGQLRCALVAGVDASALAEPLVREQLPGDRVAVLLGQKRTVIARAGSDERLLASSVAAGLARQPGGQTEGSFKEIDLDAVPLYVGFHRSALTGWTVAVGVPTAVVARPLWRGLAMLLVVGLGLVAVGMVGSWWFERRIRMPIVALSSSAEALGAGGLPRPAPASSIAEIASLAQSITDADRLLRERALGWARAEAELADQREQFRVTLASIGDAVIATDMFGRVTFMNEVARSLTGWAEEPAVGRPLDSVLALSDEETRAPIDDPFWRVMRGEIIAPVGARTLLRPRGGDEVPIECRGAPRRDAEGRTVGAVFVCRDTSERRRAERERADILARAHAARDEAEAANRAKDEFIAMLGHELRNPLGAISNAVYVLDLIGAPAAPAVQARQIISRGVQQLVRIVDDLLDVARVTRGKVILNRQPVNLADSVTECLSSLSAAGKSSRHRITVDVEATWVEADPFRIEQVITNLIANAIQYTPADRAIHVSVGSSGDRAIVRVRDSGIGISADMLPRVFDLFAQGNRPLDRPQGGLGIGLTLARSLVEAHGGTIEAASGGPGQGSEFTLRLPRVPAPAAEPERDPEAAPASPCRILIVEDSQDARDMLRIYLAQSGHQVFEAADGLGAVEAARRARPDVALVDIGLPGLDGFEVAERIRATPEGRDMFLVALSGYGQPKDQHRAREAGFDAYLVKPFDRDRLSRLLTAARRFPAEGET